MTLNEKNQNDIIDRELLDEISIEYEFDNYPINRFKIQFIKV